MGQWRAVPQTPASEFLSWAGRRGRCPARPGRGGDGAPRGHLVAFFCARGRPIPSVSPASQGIRTSTASGPSSSPLSACGAPAGCRPRPAGPPGTARPRHHPWFPVPGVPWPLTGPAPGCCWGWPPPATPRHLSGTARTGRSRRCPPEMPTVNGLTPSSRRDSVAGRIPSLRACFPACYLWRPICVCILAAHGTGWVSGGLVDARKYAPPSTMYGRCCHTYASSPYLTPNPADDADLGTVWGAVGPPGLPHRDNRRSAHAASRGLRPQDALKVPGCPRVMILHSGTPYTWPRSWGCSAYRPPRGPWWTLMKSLLDPITAGSACIFECLLAVLLLTGAAQAGSARRSRSPHHRRTGPAPRHAEGGDGRRRQGSATRRATPSHWSTSSGRMLPRGQRAAAAASARVEALSHRPGDMPGTWPAGCPGYCSAGTGPQVGAVRMTVEWGGERGPRLGQRPQRCPMPHFADGLPIAPAPARTGQRISCTAPPTGWVAVPVSLRIGTTAAPAGHAAQPHVRLAKYTPADADHVRGGALAENTTP